ncbi:hypothetical protein, partial [Pseudomonas sp.]|uniref:hypothetical protein n=1 Tax=Pseudomonas sp. TaxID=306 RepID=UPI0025FFC434
MLAFDVARATGEHSLMGGDAAIRGWQLFPRAKTKPHLLSQMGFWNLILTMTYSHMGKPHTTIG